MKSHKPKYFPIELDFEKQGNEESTQFAIKNYTGTQK